jgi:hypothetical protein
LHPHASVEAMQTVPAAFTGQVTQAPDPPHAVLLVPGWHDAPEPQQPAEQGDAGSEHVKVHRSVVVLQPALFAGQLAAVVQPHWPPPVVGSHVLPLVAAVKPAVQLAQRPPVLPHSGAPVPGWHVPAVAAEQHPVLQVWVELHAVVHVLVVVSHAWSTGQSEGVRQPQALDGVPGRQADPLALPVHVAHPGCPVLQAAPVLPVLHEPVAAQHVPLHAVSSAAPHVVLHWPATVSHAMPVGQSVAREHAGPSSAASTPASAAASTAASLASTEASTPASSCMLESTTATSAPASTANDASKVTSAKLASIGALLVL